MIFPAESCFGHWYTFNLTYLSNAQVLTGYGQLLLPADYFSLFWSRCMLELSLFQNSCFRLYLRFTCGTEQTLHVFVTFAILTIYFLIKNR